MTTTGKLLGLQLVSHFISFYIVHYFTLSLIISLARCVLSIGQLFFAIVYNDSSCVVYVQKAQLSQRNCATLHVEMFVRIKSRQQLSACHVRMRIVVKHFRLAFCSFTLLTLINDIQGHKDYKYCIAYTGSIYLLIEIIVSKLETS